MIPFFLSLALLGAGDLVQSSKIEPDTYWQWYMFQDSTQGLQVFYRLRLTEGAVRDDGTAYFDFKLGRKFAAAWSAPTSADAYRGFRGPRMALRMPAAAGQYDYSKWPVLPSAFRVDPRTGEHLGIRLSQVRVGQRVTLVFLFRPKCRRLRVAAGILQDFRLVLPAAHK